MPQNDTKRLLCFFISISFLAWLTCTTACDAGIPGDGRCLFRSVAHGACLRNGKPAPNESLQKQLADELRAMVCLSSILLTICYFILFFFLR